MTNTTTIYTTLVGFGKALIHLYNYHLETGNVAIDSLLARQQLTGEVDMSNANSSKSASRRRRRKAKEATTVKVPVPQKHCESCPNWMSGEDAHEDCVRCLGVEHAVDAVHNPGQCLICVNIPKTRLARRLARAESFFTERSEAWLVQHVREMESLSKERARHARSPSRYSESDYVDLPVKGAEPGGAEAASGKDDMPDEEGAAADADHSPPRQRARPSEGPPPASRSKQQDTADDAGVSMEEDDEGSGSTCDRSSCSGPDTDSEDGDDGDEETSPEEEVDEEERRLRATLLAGVKQRMLHPTAAPPANTAAVAAPPEVAEGQAEAPAPAPDIAQPPEKVLPMDNSDLTEVFKKATVRSRLKWPAEESPQQDTATTTWDEMNNKEAKPRAKLLLPLAQGFANTLASSWEKPNSFTFPADHKRELDCAGMADAGLQTMAPMDKKVANHLLRGKAVIQRDGTPTFAHASDKDMSVIARKSYTSLTKTARAMNAISLLQGSTTYIMKKVGDEPSADNMAELRRNHKEIMLLTKYCVELTGQAMAGMVVLERFRWLNYSPQLTVAERSGFLDQPLSQDNLFSNTVDNLIARLETDKTKCEALAAYLPTEPKKAPAKSQPARAYDRDKKRHYGDRDSRSTFRAPEAARASSASAGRQRPAKKDNKGGRKPSASPGGQHRRAGAKQAGGGQHRK